MELKRTLNLFDATSIGIGAIIGAGIFVVLGIAVGSAGPAVIVWMIIAGTVPCSPRSALPNSAPQFQKREERTNSRMR